MSEVRPFAGEGIFKGARPLLIKPESLTTDLNHLFVIVMAGGASSRFFPVNKVFSDLTGENRTMIQQAFDRATRTDIAGAYPSFVPPERFFVVTGEEFASTMRQQLNHVPSKNILVDPARRNTLPAILWAVSHIRLLDPDATVAILTADHVIRDLPIFRDTIVRAAAVAERARAIVAIGIRPNADTKEWTGFGAIKSDSTSSPFGTDIRRLLRFEEKPGSSRAEEMIREGGWAWNAGMFLFQVKTLERAIAVYQPGIFATYTAVAEAVAAGRIAESAAQFEAFPGKVAHPFQEGKQVDNSIDYAVMVPLTTRPELAAIVEVYVIQGSFFWVDIGSWDALRKVVPADAEGNVVVGDVRVESTRRSILVAERGREIEAHGVEGLIVVHASNGTVMLAPESRAQEVKQLFEAARTSPGGDNVMLESDNCQVEAAPGRVVALGIRDMAVTFAGARVRIRAILHAGNLAKQIASPSPGPPLRAPVFMSKNPVELGFGTSGMRGLVTDMTDMEVYINACGFLQWLKEGRAYSGTLVALGGDLRPSTDRIMRAIVKAIEDCGMIAEHHGRIPTPALAAYAISRRMPCLMVTGSHIPIDRNGIKFYREDAEVLKPDEAPIKAMVARRRQTEYGKTASQSDFKPDGMFKVETRPLDPPNSTALNKYLQRYLSAFPNQPLKGKIIVVYQHSAVGRDFLMQLMSSLGATVFAVNRSRDDEFVAIDTEDVRPEYLSLFQRFAMDYPDLFAIVSTDGDSDRPIVVDAHGHFHRGDVLGIVTAEFLDTEFAAVPVSASDAVDERLIRAGIRHQKTRIGSPYVIEAMNAAKVGGVGKVVGWEVNGGFLTGSDFTIDGNVLPSLSTRDAMLPILAALVTAVRQQKTLSQVFDELPRRFTQAGLIDNFPSETAAKPILRRFSLGDLGYQEVTFSDAGIRITKADGTIEAIVPSDVRTLDLIEKRKEIERYFSTNLGFDAVHKINQVDGIRITFATGDAAHLRASSNAPQMRIYSAAATQGRADEIVRLGICEDFDAGEPLGILRRMERDVLHGS
jgi:phosphomannomutase